MFSDVLPGARKLEVVAARRNRRRAQRATYVGKELNRGAVLLQNVRVFVDERRMQTVQSVIQTHLRGQCGREWAETGTLTDTQFVLQVDLTNERITDEREKRRLVYDR